MSMFNPGHGPKRGYNELVTGVKHYGAGMIGAAQSGKLGSGGYNERERSNDAKKRALARRKAIQSQNKLRPS